MENLNTSTPPVDNLPQDAKSDRRKSLTIVLAFLIGVLFIALGAFAGYSFYQWQNLASKIENQDSISEDNLSGQEFTDITEDQAPIIAGDISWISPKISNSLNIFKKIDSFDPEADARYYKVGDIITGKYEGGEIFIISAPINGMGGPVYYRLVKQGDNLIYLQKYSEENYADMGLGLDETKFTIDDSYTIPQLEFPEEIYGPDGKTKLLLDIYNTETFFYVNNLKKVFTHSKLGNVYTTINSNTTDLFGRNGFYVKAVDGTTRVYILKPDFIDETKGVQVTWSDGTTNKSDYSYTDPGGCGDTSYASVSYVSSNDLKVSGKTTSGNIIYELINNDHYILKDLYDNRYQVWGDQEKVPYDVFISEHPIFFWMDPFGRYIKFENTAYGPVVECGKPVIYLYPKKTEKVSVKVEPLGGMSYSDPDYNGGWDVVAEPDGKLTEISSGKEYPYLFWEGRGRIYEQPKKGFVINQSQVHSFLIEKLAKLGLNNKETADFIEFWEPRMQGSPYYFVTFLGTRGMDQIAPLTITPKPDTIIRILMDFSPLDKPIQVEGYTINTPKREGFTVIEWGGVIR